MLITEARCSDVKMTADLPWNAGSIVVMDRGYTDYALFGRGTAGEIYFVPRLKENAAFAVLAECVGPRNRNILSDQLRRFTGQRAQQDCPCLWRRVPVWDEANQRERLNLFTYHDL